MVGRANAASTPARSARRTNATAFGPGELGANSRNCRNGLGVALHFFPSLRRLLQAPGSRILPKIPMRADLIEYEEAYCRRQIALALLVNVLKQLDRKSVVEGNGI